MTFNSTILYILDQNLLSSFFFFFNFYMINDPVSTDTTVWPFSLPFDVGTDLSLSYICHDHRTILRSAIFPTIFLEIVGDRGLRRMCLQFIPTSYDFLICLFSTF